MSHFRKCLIAVGMRYVGGTRRFASFDQSNEKAFMPSVSGHKYLELNLLSASLLYSRPTQNTSKCMLWSKVKLKMFRARRWICVLLLPHFIIC